MITFSQKHIILKIVIVISVIFIFSINKTFTQIQLLCDAGYNDTICLGDSVQIGNIGGFRNEWSPATGLSNAHILKPWAKPTQTTTYYMTSYQLILAKELIKNGDFEQGNIYFTSSYNYLSNLGPEGSYNVTSNPNSVHGAFSPCTDHSSGNGKMMVVNGAPGTNVVIWEQTIYNIIPNSDYAFSTWLQTVYPSSPAELQFSINGVPIGSIFRATYQTCEWNQFYEIWNSGSYTSATISIVNQNTQHMGNDFALDDISFTTMSDCLDSVTIVVIPRPVAEAGNDKTICSGKNTYLTASGGNNYVWSNGKTTASIKVQPAITTTYTVTVSNPGCIDTDDVIITVISSPTADAGLNDTICMGHSSTLTATGGGAYKWNTNATSASITVNPITTTTYTVTVTNPNGCTNSDNVIVVVYPAVSSTFTVTSPVCFGDNIIVTYTGNATPAATYMWNFDGGNIISGAGQGPYKISWSSPGTYNVSLTVEENGCISPVTTIPVTVYPMPTSDFTADSLICFSDNAKITYTGSASPTANFIWNFNGGNIISGSGRGPYQISWSSPGSYNVSLTVIEPPCTSKVTIKTVIVYEITSTFTADMSLCLGDNSTITYTGNGTSSGTYIWDFDGATIISGSGQGPYQISWNNTGTYNISLYVIEKGCTSIVSAIPVYVYPIPTSDFTATHPICFGDKSIITYTGTASTGAKYNWNFDGGNITSGSGQGPYEIKWNSTGTYNISLYVIENGCTSLVSTIPVHVYPIPTSTFTANTLICMGDTFTVTYTGNATPAANYTWNFGGATVITGSGQGPFKIKWSSSGTFYITLTVEENGCSSSTTIGVNVKITPTSPFTTLSPICIGDNSTITYTGNAFPAATYVWDFDGGVIITGYGQGPYQITWSDTGTYNLSLVVIENGCTSTVSNAQVIVYPIPTSDFFGTSSCFGQNSVITYTGTASSSATYKWDFNGGTVMSGSGQGPYEIYWSAPGKYTISLIVTEHGCISPVTTDTITVFPIPTSDFTVVSPVCLGDSSIITYIGTASPAASYTWDFGTGVILSGTGQGPYAVKWTPSGRYAISLTVEENGCVSDTTIDTVTIYHLTSSMHLIKNVICYGGNDGSAYVIITGGVGKYAYNWLPVGISNDTATGLHEGDYTVTATDSNGCMVTDSITITQPTMIEAAIDITDVLCHGHMNGSATVHPAGGTPPYTFVWYTTPALTGPTITNVGAGTYYVTIIDSSGCDTTIPVTINQPQPLQVVLIPHDEGCVNSCNGYIEAIVTGGTPPYSYSWNSRPVQNTAIAGNLCVGNYKVVITDANNCVVWDSADIKTRTLIDASFTANPVEGVAPLTVDFTFTGSGANTFDWYFGDGNTSSLQDPSNTYYEEEQYEAVLIVNSGAPDYCTDTARMIIIIEPPFDITVPNVFTPNGDGTNDYFRIECNWEIEEYLMEVYNRWGLLLFSSENDKVWWDGRTYSGEMAPDGVYYFILKIKADTKDYNTKGTVTLIR